MNGVKITRVRDNGDATATYKIEVTKEVMLIDFCKDIVMSSPKECGSIYINGEKIADYNYGKCTVEGAFYRCCCRPVISGWANGGWGAMDYHVKVEE